ncbi:MAG: hypothetical protein IJH64_10205 [Oscillospiraceae bacterium]|nr:hypothetical protein [Oscillospiraceae bacterium]
MDVTVNDLIARWRPLSADEIAKAQTYITDVENALHVYAHDRGLDLDQLLADYEPRQGLYVAVVCDVVKREMTSATDDSPAMTQYSQSVNGYSVQGTFLSAGGGLFIKNSELKLLGLQGQKARAVDIYGDQGDSDNS